MTSGSALVALAARPRFLRFDGPSTALLWLDDGRFVSSVAFETFDASLNLLFLPVRVLVRDGSGWLEDGVAALRLGGMLAVVVWTTCATMGDECCISFPQMCDVVEEDGSPRSTDNAGD